MHQVKVAYTDLCFLDKSDEKNVGYLGYFRHDFQYAFKNCASLVFAFAFLQKTKFFRRFNGILGYDFCLQKSGI